MDRLSFIDHFLYKAGECGLPALNMQGAMILDPEKGGYPVDAMAIAEHIAARLSGFSILRKRLVQDALRLGDVKIVDDPEFDVWDHITFSTLPSPGNDVALSRRLGKFSAEPLDSNKPLWRFEIIEGLEGGRIAIVQKLSHAIMDGKAAMKIMQSLFDFEPAELDRLNSTSWPAAALPSNTALMSEAISETALRVTRRAPKAIYQISKFVISSGKSYIHKKVFIENITKRSGGKKNAAKRTSLNTEISNDRRNISFISFDLDRLKVLSKSLECTMNDLCLLVSTEAMLNYFRAIGEPIDFDLQLCMPISTRTASSREHGNELKLAAINAHNTIHELPARILRIREDTLATKVPKSTQLSTNIDNENLISSLLPLLIDMACFGLSAAKPWKHFPVLFNSIVTNIPGPLQSIYFCGMPVECQLPIIPMFHTGALSIGATSMGGHLTFGFHACGRVVMEADMACFTLGAESAVHSLEKSVLEDRSFKNKVAPQKRRARKATTTTSKP